MIEKGHAAPLGTHSDDGGANFAIFSGAADRVELCLFDQDGKEHERIDLPEQTDGIWHGYLPGCRVGQRYGYRVHGRYAPSQGLRFNPNKLLIDPYARELDGRFRWSPEVFDFVMHGEELRLSESDSAPFIPKSVVSEEMPGPRRHSAIPWSEMIIYEANVRGYTMRHPDVPEAERGKYRGMHNGEILDYMKALGITSIELMPVHEFIDEQFLHTGGLRNFWAYNTINFFAPARRYASVNPRHEFVDMIDSIHDAGLEVILDVAYNHTGETGRLGPTISFRGIDNLTYYRTAKGGPGEYINDTGCGNTINVDHPAVRDLVLDSLRYWSVGMGVDGFRFDLATVMGRAHDGFSGQHPMLQAIESDSVLKNVKLIAEPWDPGPGGYQLGNFAPRWAEWNDQYRDSVRRYWRGDINQAGEFARRIHGSADLFDSNGRNASASVNLVSAHDGFSLADVVSFEERHNSANGENNNDGHAHNYSRNYGVEGETSDRWINEIRRRQRLNMLATLLFSQGTPMLLAGDEFGNSQDGNNNAFAQDNEIGWLDWSGVAADPDFLEVVRRLIRLRRHSPLLRDITYRHGESRNVDGWRNIEWLDADGSHLNEEAWHQAHAFTMLLSDVEESTQSSVLAVAILLNASDSEVAFHLPQSSRTAAWRLEFSSSSSSHEQSAEGSWTIIDHSIACLLLEAG